MNTFLHYFQAEVHYLKQLVAAFGNDYLELEEIQHLLTSNASVAYIIEHCAFLRAELRRKVEDRFPEIIQNLLISIRPTPLWPLPCTTPSQLKLERTVG